MPYDSSNNSITCTIVEHLAVIARSESGYSKEANIIRWNDGDPKLDIREWTPDHSPRKGLTFTLREAVILKDALSNFLEDPDQE